MPSEHVDESGLDLSLIEKQVRAAGSVCLGCGEDVARGDEGQHVGPLQAPPSYDPLEPTHRSVPMAVMSATLDRLEALQADNQRLRTVATGLAEALRSMRHLTSEGYSSYGRMVEALADYDALIDGRGVSE
jgi:hypothetical protein